MLTFHRRQTPSCFYPNRAALSLPASQLHFLLPSQHIIPFVVWTLPLLERQHPFGWRGGHKYWKKPQNQQPKKHQLFDFAQTLAAFADVPEEMAEWAWIRQSSPRRTDLITWPCHSWQGKDVAHAPGEDKVCTAGIAFRAVHGEGSPWWLAIPWKDLCSPAGWTTSQAASYRCLSVLDLSPSFLGLLPWKVFSVYAVSAGWGLQGAK